MGSGNDGSPKFGLEGLTLEPSLTIGRKLGGELSSSVRFGQDIILGNKAFTYEFVAEGGYYSKNSEVPGDDGKSNTPVVGNFQYLSAGGGINLYSRLNDISVFGIGATTGVAGREHYGSFYSSVSGTHRYFNASASYTNFFGSISSSSGDAYISVGAKYNYVAPNSSDQITGLDQTRSFTYYGMQNTGHQTGTIYMDVGSYINPTPTTIGIGYSKDLTRNIGSFNITAKLTLERGNDKEGNAPIRLYEIPEEDLIKPKKSLISDNDVVFDKNSLSNKPSRIDADIETSVDKTGEKGVDKIKSYRIQFPYNDKATNAIEKAHVVEYTLVNPKDANAYYLKIEKDVFVDPDVKYDKHGEKIYHEIETSRGKVSQESALMEMKNNPASAVPNESHLREVNKKGHEVEGTNFSELSTLMDSYIKKQLGTSMNISKEQHEAIISQDIWDKVQEKLAQTSVIRSRALKPERPKLVGKIFDYHGNRLSPTYSYKYSKNGRYKMRYYINREICKIGKTNSEFRRIRVDYLDKIVADELSTLIEILIKAVSKSKNPDLSSGILKLLKDLTSNPTDLLSKIILFPQHMELLLNLKGGDKILSEDSINEIRLTLQKYDLQVTSSSEHLLAIKLNIPAQYKKFGSSLCIITNGQKSDDTEIEKEYYHPEDKTFILIAKSFYWNKLIREGMRNSPNMISKTQNHDVKYIKRAMRQRFLSPKIIKKITSSDKSNLPCDKQIVSDQLISYNHWCWKTQEKAFLG